ncbi:hypothetical protein B484DRAFT_461279, partial [Ochromonadaceae sp. CCMP2298]
MLPSSNDDADPRASVSSRWYSDKLAQARECARGGLHQESLNLCSLVLMTEWMSVRTSETSRACSDIRRLRLECLFALGRQAEVVEEGLGLLGAELDHADPVATAWVVHSLLIIEPSPCVQFPNMQQRLRRCESLIESLTLVLPDQRELINSLTESLTAAGSRAALEREARTWQAQSSRSNTAPPRPRRLEREPSTGEVALQAADLAPGRNDSGLPATGATEEEREDRRKGPRPRTRHAGGHVTVREAVELRMRTVNNPCKFCYMISAMQLLAASQVLQAYVRDIGGSSLLPTLGADTGEPAGARLLPLVVAWMQLLRPTDDRIPRSYMVPEAETALLARSLMQARRDAVGGAVVEEGGVVPDPFLDPANQWVKATGAKGGSARFFRALTGRDVPFEQDIGEFIAPLL